MPQGMRNYVTTVAAVVGFCNTLCKSDDKIKNTINVKHATSRTLVCTIGEAIPAVQCLEVELLELKL